MAIPSYRSSGARAGNAGANTPSAPGDHQTNDIELLQVESADEGAVTLSTAAGFAEISGSPVSAANADIAIATRITVFWRRWNGSDGNPTIADVGNHTFAQIHAFSGCITSGNPWDITVGSAETTEDTSGSATGGTTTVADCLIAILAVSAKPDAVDAQRYSGWTNADLANPSIAEHQDGSTNAGNGGAMALATGGKAGAGTFAATTYTHTTATYKAHLVVALKPPTSVTTPQTLAATSTFTAAMTPATIFARTLAATSAFTAAMTQALIFARTLAVTSTFTPAMAKMVGLTLAVASTFTPAMVKLVGLTLAVSSTLTPAMVKTMFKTLEVASAFAVTMTTALLFQVALAVTSTFTAALSRAAIYVQTLAATSTFVAALSQLFIPGEPDVGGTLPGRLKRWLSRIL